MKKSKVKAGVKFKAWHYIVFVVMAIVMAAMIVADSICYTNAQAITNLLCGRGIIFEGEEVSRAMAESDALVRNICDEGIILLKNEGGDSGKGVLPLAESNRKLNLFGWSSTDNGFLLTGFGSGAATIHAAKKKSLRAGLEEQGFEINTKLLNKYKSYKADREDEMESDDPFTLIEPSRGFYDANTINEAKQFSDTALIVFTRNGGESVEMPTWQKKYNQGVDRSRTYLQLSKEEESLIELVTENFENVIVILNTANPLELGFLDNDKIDAALNVGFCGQSGTNAIGRILKGEVNPSGRTVDTYAYDWKSLPSYADRLKNGDDTNYTENIYIGYKWYETAFAEKLKHEAYGKTFDYSTEEGYRNIVKYPFGYGLSYTKFEWKVNGATVIAGDERSDLSGAQINSKSARIELDISVTNTGDVAGRDTVQLYYSAPYIKGGIEKAAVALADFEKTELLYPASVADDEHPNTQNIKLGLDLYDMASYDCYDKNGNGLATYELDPGQYSVSLRNNAHEVNACQNAEIRFTLPQGFNYKLDPKTKRVVKNRFTGESAYAGVPIDGSTVGTAINYMTRNDFASTFPVKTTAKRTGAAVKKAARYIYGGYDGVAAPSQGKSGSLRIWTRENGKDATAEDLKGTSGVSLKLNEELVKELGNNYRAERWDSLLNQITKDELFTLVESSGYCNDEMTSIGKAYHRDPDGPSGFLADYGSVVDTSKWTGFISETMLAATFSKLLAFQFGRAVGNEGATTAISGWYAPAANLHRTPFNGRYFEYYSEDGVLSGNMAAYTIKGAASANMYCYMKHLALSEMGINPKGVNVWVTEQALRETYLRPFEIAVKDGEANAMMSAFNNIGATWAGGNKALLTDILRTEWGFKGTVITDWSTGDENMPIEQGIRAGNDIWLNPNDSATVPLDRDDATNVYLARNSAHNMLYTICNTYARHASYNPADGEFAVSVGIRKVNEVFAWWIPVLVALNVLVFGIIIFEVVWIIVKARKRFVMKLAAAERGVSLSVVEAEAKAERARKRAEKKNNKNARVDTSQGIESCDEANDEDASVTFSHIEADASPEVSAVEETSDEGDCEHAATFAQRSAPGVEQEKSAPSNVSAENAAIGMQAENAALKEQVSELISSLSAFTALSDEIKALREKQAIKAKNRSAKKPDAPKQPTAKQQIAELKKELEEIKSMLNTDK